MALGKEIENEIPENPFSSYFGPDFKIHMPVSNMENHNPKEELERITKKIMENLKHIDAVNVDHSSFRNNGGHPQPVLKVDEKEMAQAKADKNMDENNDK